MFVNLLLGQYICNSGLS